MAQIIQLRRDLAANWTAANPTLAQGEVGYELDTNQLKFGNGIDDWNTRPYFSPEPVLNVVQTDADLVITNQDFVRAIGNNPITITMPAFSRKRITINNTSTQILTILPASGTINGVASLQLEPLLDIGFQEGNLGESVTLIYQGDQFWRT